MKKLAYLSFLLLLACSGNKENNQTNERVISEAFLPKVATAKVESKQLQRELTLSGRVTADPGRTVTFSPLVSGVIVRSYFTLGDHVNRGQTMLDIRSAELSELQSELAIAKRTLQSTQSLLDSGMATELELVEAQSTLEKLEADLALYGESKGNGVFSVTAPISGYVIEREGNAGSTISAEGDPLFSIADLSTVWVEASVHAGNLQFVQRGQRVEVSSSAYPNEVFNGTIDFISQVFDPENRALTARIVLPNRDLKLKSEMPVMVKLFNDSEVEMTTIPSEAVIFDNNRYFVVVASGNDFSNREITIYTRNNGTTYIANGLQPGEEIVTRNQLLVYNELKGR
ncbi:MAG: efflux RND transporter periplasmic adaptor subunit [Dysgonamonadaceae bacterium]|jgi:cobalt-zinc-cadmium efflux system membrane fusion protein|nr:efflux RND transporter periplasmic adaptor subunit [Dysgonamonadaceae bacterium]